jgi:hypothetical protein
VGIELLEVPEYDLLENQEAVSVIKELSLIRKRDNSVMLTRRLDIRGLRGLGKHLWKGVEAQEYVKGLRREWDK